MNVHYLIGEGTLDALMLKTLENKIGVVGRVLDGESQNMKVEILSKGAIGHFEPQTIPESTMQPTTSRESKITDYFKPNSTKSTKK